MADITKDLSNIIHNKGVIETAAYGKDVRAAMAGALQALCNVLTTLNTDVETSHSVTVTNQLIDNHESIKILDATNKTSILILGNGEIILDKDTDTSEMSTLAQTRICKRLNDDDVNLETIDLNTIEQLCNCIDIIVDIKDSGTSFQLTGGPNIQYYESCAFHFTRLYNVEYFRSFYDYSLWMRKDKGTWMEIAAVPPSVG